MPRREIRISDTLSLPLDAVTETFAILAKRRVGKSNAAVVMAEEMDANDVPWVAIDPKGDWWGVRSDADGSGPGLAVPVFGGKHGDMELHPDSGAYFAEMIATRRLSCVLDVSLFSHGERIRFLRPFATRLLAVNEEPLHLFLEECDDYIPQSAVSPRGGGKSNADENELMLVREWSRLVRHGGFKGIGCTLITQRPALVSKNVLSQCETYIIMRTLHPADQDEVARYVKKHPLAAEIMGSLSTLRPGEAWVYSPAFLETVQRIMFRRRRTFDSGATPKMGERRKAPTRLADVDLAAIKDAMSETIEAAKADDPRELRKQIAALGQEAVRLGRERDAIRAELDAERAAEKVRIDEVRIFSDEDQRALGEVDESLDRLGSTLAALRASILDRLPVGAKEGTTADSRPVASSRPETPVTSESVVRPRNPRTPSVRRAGTPTREGVAAPAEIGDGDTAQLSSSQEAILDALAWFTSVRINAPTRTQVAFQSGVSPKSSGFEKNCSTLRTRGLIEFPLAGRLALTKAGVAVANPPEIPATSEALQESIMSRLSSSQRTILTAMIDVYPDVLDRESLADRCQVSPQSSGYEKNLSTLRSFGLLDYPQRGLVAATELLFID